MKFNDFTWYDFHINQLINIKGGAQLLELSMEQRRAIYLEVKREEEKKWRSEKQSQESKQKRREYMRDYMKRYRATAKN